jgi:hypothetical protein
VPFIRQVRDKRGYETTYVMHAYRPVPGPQRTRVLYLFRSPSHIRFGRRALDEEAREALEHTHPDVSFDWTVLGRESAVRPDPPRERDRYIRPRRQAPASPPAGPAPVVLDDETPLGRVLGGEAAAGLRARYAELMQRITRRARTPEDRDRLLEQAQRLNPDEWSDEATVRAAAPGVDAAWDALVAELPARRRGRRGGRRRADGEPVVESAGASPAPDTSGASVILEERGGGEIDAGAEEQEEQMAGDDRHADPAGDRGRVGPESEPGAVPGDD